MSNNLLSGPERQEWEEVRWGIFNMLKDINGRLAKIEDAQSQILRDLDVQKYKSAVIGLGGGGGGAGLIMLAIKLLSGSP